MKYLNLKQRQRVSTVSSEATSDIIQKVKKKQETILTFEMYGCSIASKNTST